MASQGPENQQEPQQEATPEISPPKLENSLTYNPFYQNMLYQNMVYPNIYATAQLAPGTYYSTIDQEFADQEEDYGQRRLNTMGVSLVLLGLLSVLLGLLIVLLSNWYVHFVIVVGVPWWSGLLSTVSGMLALGARGDSSNSMTIGCLMMNVVNCLASLPAAILYMLSVDFVTCFWYFCFQAHRERLISVLLLLLVMSCVSCFLLSIVVSSVNCRRLRCCTSEPQTTMIVVQPPPPATPIPAVSPGEQPPAYSAAPAAAYTVPV